MSLVVTCSSKSSLSGKLCPKYNAVIFQAFEVILCYLHQLSCVVMLIRGSCILEMYECHSVFFSFLSFCC